ncbi:hypothetical protein [Paenarthrobacter sp. A20]|uniref:hypothetical protein n=1 Tax=Paenarthrobacter sp. A20 TaxID=2817891 RepID=UPI0020A05AD7|nr:hypothetical protein [Paenarthrobacter sp. A20]MCP1414393.1 transposase-like protein [Paenarthrobacter sp. A20]
MPASKYTEEQRAEAIELFRTDGPSAVQEQLGIPKATVAGWAKAAGVRTVRTSATRAATEARAVDLKASRQELTALLLEDAHKLRKQLWQPARLVNFGGKDNTLAETTLDEPLFVDKKNILSAVGIAVDRVIKLEAVDKTGEESGAAVDKWLEHMMGGDHGGETAAG